MARLTCSDSDCPQEMEAEAYDLRELEALACECGCAMAIVAWPDWIASPPLAGDPASAARGRRTALCP